MTRGYPNLLLIEHRTLPTLNFSVGIHRIYIRGEFIMHERHESPNFDPGQGVFDDRTGLGNEQPAETQLAVTPKSLDYDQPEIIRPAIPATAAQGSSGGHTPDQNGQKLWP